MFDIGWTELLVIGIVALIVVGPKDLPGMFKALGRFTAKMRNLAREFQRAMNQAADESGVSDITSDLKALRSAKSLGLDAVQDAADRFKGGWKTGLDQAGSTSAAEPAGSKAESSAAAKDSDAAEDSMSAVQTSTSSAEAAAPPPARSEAAMATEAEPKEAESPEPAAAKAESASKADG